MTATKRVSVSLPADIAGHLDFISKRLGISRSALVAQLLIAADLGSVHTLLSTLPESATDTDVRRFRGDSKEYVREQLERLSDLQGGLFDGSTD